MIVNNQIIYRILLNGENKKPNYSMEIVMKSDIRSMPNRLREHVNHHNAQDNQTNTDNRWHIDALLEYN